MWVCAEVVRRIEASKKRSKTDHSGVLVHSGVLDFARWCRSRLLLKGRLQKSIVHPCKFWISADGTQYECMGNTIAGVMVHFFHHDVDRTLQIGPTDTNLPYGYENGSLLYLESRIRLFRYILLHINNHLTLLNPHWQFISTPIPSDTAKIPEAIRRIFNELSFSQTCATTALLTEPNSPCFLNSSYLLFKNELSNNWHTSSVVRNESNRYISSDCILLWCKSSFDAHIKVHQKQADEKTFF